MLGLAQPLPPHCVTNSCAAQHPIIEADRFKTDEAAVTIHSFSKTGTWFEDFAMFARLLGLTATPDRLLTDVLPSGLPPSCMATATPLSSPDRARASRQARRRDCRDEGTARHQRPQRSADIANRLACPEGKRAGRYFSCRRERDFALPWRPGALFFFPGADEAAPQGVKRTNGKTSRCRG